MMSSIVSGATVCPRDRGVRGLAKLRLLGGFLDAIVQKSLLYFFDKLPCQIGFQELGV